MSHSASDTKRKKEKKPWNRTSVPVRPVRYQLPAPPVRFQTVRADGNCTIAALVPITVPPVPVPPVPPFPLVPMFSPVPLAPVQTGSAGSTGGSVRLVQPVRSGLPVPIRPALVRSEFALRSIG